MSMIFLLISLGFLWGTSFPLAKYVMSLGVQPLDYAFYQAFGSVLVLSVYRYFTGHKFFIQKNIPYIKYFITAGFLGCMIPNLNRFYLTTEVPSGILALVINTTPLFIYPLAIFFKEENFTSRRFFGVLVGFAGIAFVTLQQNFLTNIHYNRFFLLVFISPLSYALCSVYIAKTAQKIGDSSLYAMGMLYFSAIFIFIFKLLGGHPVFASISSNAFVGIILEIIISSLGYIILFNLLKRFGAVCYSTTDGVVIITSLIWGYIFFKETIHFDEFIAIILIITGIRLVVKKGQKNETLSKFLDSCNLE